MKINDPIMTSKRTVKTIPEQYDIGNDVIFNEAIRLIVNNKKLSDDELFRKLPFIGYLYIPATYEFKSWWYDTNADIVKAKVVMVDSDTVTYYHIDDHNSGIALMRSLYANFRVKSNTLQTEKT